MAATRLTPRTVRRLAWRAGFDGVAGLAKSIGRHRITVYNAIRNPKHHGPTLSRIREALGITTNL